MEFREMVDAEDDNIAAIADWLNGTTHEVRAKAVCTLSRRSQRRLWHKAESQPLMTLSDLVPISVGASRQVIHHGWNTLPLPAPLRRFQKRFCRPLDDDSRLFGYNEGLVRGLIGPGYFQAVSSHGKVSWEERGGVTVDYFRVPDADVVEGWPRVRANSRGLQFFVYHRTRDFLRKISTHVSVGATYKNQKALDHYFMLCREETSIESPFESARPAPER